MSRMVVFILGVIAGAGGTFAVMRPRPAAPVETPAPAAAEIATVATVVSQPPAPAVKPRRREPMPDADRGETRIRDALLARAAELGSCPAPAGAARVQVRLRVDADGKLTAVKAESRGVAPELLRCVQERVSAWSIDAGLVATPTDASVTFNFGA